MTLTSFIKATESVLQMKHTRTLTVVGMQMQSGGGIYGDKASIIDVRHSEITRNTAGQVSGHVLQDFCNKQNYSPRMLKKHAVGVTWTLVADIVHRTEVV